MFLNFIRPYVAEKWYAETPSGEYQISAACGLIEWRDGERIDHTGGDRQISDHRGLWTHSSSSRAPMLRGFQQAFARYRNLTN